LSTILPVEECFPAPPRLEEPSAILRRVTIRREI